MRTLAQIEALVETDADGTPQVAAQLYLNLGEEVLEHWLTAHSHKPTQLKVEGFRLLALHKQSARGDPSFNACRETCRELVYHYNLIGATPDHPEIRTRLMLMRLVVSHLYYFVSGKMQNAQLGEFCCSSRDLRLEQAS